MRLLPIATCQPGMRLARRVYNEEGLVLLGEHVELTQLLINRLGALGIDFVYVEDPRTDDVQLPEIISEETRVKATRTIRTSFRKMMEDSTRKKAVNQYQLGKLFGSLINDIIDDVSGNAQAMIMLSDMQLMDNHLYRHSLNVCIYSMVLGISSGMKREELMTFGLGALLHDIGKTQLDQQMLLKPGKLTPEEFEEIKRHPEFGFRLLKDEPNLSLLVAHCAFQHHERLDGSGYPRGIRGDEIHDYAKWLGIVDSFDAMTTHRVYRPAMLPHQALEVLFTGAGTLFDPAKISVFRDKIAIYPIGVMLRLSTGEAGVVVDLNGLYPQRPIVRVLIDADGQDLQTPYEIDLSKKLSIVVTAVNV